MILSRYRYRYSFVPYFTDRYRFWAKITQRYATRHIMTSTLPNHNFDRNRFQKTSNYTKF